MMSCSGIEPLYDRGNDRLTESHRCMMWCMQRTNIYLSSDQIGAMDQLAGQMGVSRSEAIRHLIDQSMSQGVGLDDQVEAILASFGVLRDIKPIERGETERDRYLAEIWQR